jgi:phage virion morphogenesis protein
MAEAAISFDLKEIDAVKKMLAKAALNPEKRAKLLEDIGSEMIEQTEERFEIKKSPKGDTWKAIAEKTLLYYMRKKERVEPKPPLVLEGYLRPSLDREVQGGAWSLLVGSIMEYAAVHQFGWPEKNITARPYLGVSADDTKAIENAAANFLGKF